MRIVDTTNLGNTTPAQTGRTGQLHSTDASGKTGSAPRIGSSATDSVELSSFADRLSRTMQDAGASRAQRVTELTAAVRAGSYQVDAKAVSHALVSQALSSGSSGKP
jgi:flagellar biosynthesis anti-sigma factor FlgM